MTDLFLKVLNTSITAGYLVLAVVALRLLLKKAPRWIMVLLWSLVAIRLICPFSMESVLSLIPSAEVVSPEIMLSPTPTINSGIPAFNATINPILNQTMSPTPSDSVNPMQVLIFVASQVWLAGLLGMTLYAAISYWRLRRRIATACRHSGNIFLSETVASPFVLGLIRPKIYLPSGMDEGKQAYVIAHEQAHIRRKDHWWKPLGFLLLAIHWFHPLMWLAYILLCRDIELACDEKVIKELGSDQRADYSEALLSCSVNRKMIAACPLAFGEVGVKERVKNVLRYKKPAFWIIIVAVLACIVVAVCLLTDPIMQVHAEHTRPGDSLTAEEVPGPLEEWHQIAGLADQETCQFQLEAFPGITFRWNVGTVEAVTETDTTTIIDALMLKDIGAVDLNLDGFPEICVTAVRSTEKHSCYVIVYDYAAGKSYTFPSGDRNTGYYLYTRSNYLMCGMEGLKEDETYVSGRLMLTGTGESAALTIITPPQMTQYTGTPMVLFDKESADSPLKAQVKLDAFPGVIFKWDHSALINNASERLIAVKNGVETELFPSGFVDCVYIDDVTGDGCPDFCANAYFFFSGLSSFNAVYVYDYANDRTYVLSEAVPNIHYKNVSFFIRLEDGQLICHKVHVATDQTLASGTLAFADGKLYLDAQVTYDSPVIYTFRGKTVQDEVRMTMCADGTFTIQFHLLTHDGNDADRAQGTYTREGDKITIHAKDGRHFTFRFEGDDLIFLAKESSDPPDCCALRDGDLLVAQPCLTPEETG